MTHPPRPSTAAWIKSSYSTKGEGCLQIRPLSADMIEIGDTKTPAGPTLTVPAHDWASFLDQVASGADHYTGRLQPEFHPDGGLTLRDAADPASPTLAYTPEEWDAFRAGARAGELRALAPGYSLG